MCMYICIYIYNFQDCQQNQNNFEGVRKHHTSHKESSMNVGTPSLIGTQYGHSRLCFFSPFPIDMSIRNHTYLEVTHDYHGQSPCFNGTTHYKWPCSTHKFQEGSILAKKLSIVMQHTIPSSYC